MADLSAEILKLSGRPVLLETATVTSVEPLTVTVGGIDVPALNLTGHRLMRNEPVWTTRHNGIIRVTHIVTPRPQMGTVVTATGAVAVVEAGGRTFTDVPIIVGTPDPGATVALSWGADGAIGFVTAAVPAMPPAPPAPPPATAPSSPDDVLTIDARAISARTARGGSWRTDGTASRRAYQGRYSGGVAQDNSGFWFYGTDALRADGVGLSAVLRLTRPSEVGTAGKVGFRVATHTAPTQPGTPPALTYRATVYIAWGKTETIDLGATVAQQMLDGTIAGVGLLYSGTSDYGALLGPDESPLSGQLTINYRRR